MRATDRELDAIAMEEEEEDASDGGQHREHTKRIPRRPSLRQQPSTVRQGQRRPAARAGPDQHPRTRTQQEDPQSGESGGDQGRDAEDQQHLPRSRPVLLRIARWARPVPHDTHAVGDRNHHDRQELQCEYNGEGHIAVASGVAKALPRAASGK